MMDNPPHLEDLCQQAAHRREVPNVPKTNGFRLINGPADHAPPGLTLDRYDQWLVIGARSSVKPNTITLWAEAARRVFKPDGIILKTIETSATQSRSEVLWGPKTPPKITIYEEDARFECLLNDGPQTGLFLDHRNTRWRARDFANNVEVLNLFAYTGSFSVHCALAGSARVTSVDVSQRALQWGRRNMELSQLNPDQHRWFNDDALVHLKRARRSYHLVILDPPVFGHGRKPFSLAKDLGQLIHGAFEQLAHQGVLIFSTHHLDLGHRHLYKTCQQQALALGITIEELAHMGLPEWDHPTQATASDDRGRYLNTFILRIHRN